MVVSVFVPFGRSGFRKKILWEIDVHLVAQMPTAALSTNCLQFNPAPGIPCNAPKTLGQAGFTAPIAAAAYRALSVGKYKLNAAQERYVREPERS
jgi:hypothetical protein